MQYENIDDAWAVYAILSTRPNEDPLKLPGLMELLISIVHDDVLISPSVENPPDCPFEAGRVFSYQHMSNLIICEMERIPLFNEILKKHATDWPSLSDPKECHLFTARTQVILSGEKSFIKNLTKRLYNFLPGIFTNVGRYCRPCKTHGKRGNQTGEDSAPKRQKPYDFSGK